MRKQQRLLIEIKRLPLLRRQLSDVTAAQADPAGIGRLQARDHPKQGRLATAGSPEHGQRSPPRQLDPHVFEDRCGGVTFGQARRLQALPPDR